MDLILEHGRKARNDASQRILHWLKSDHRVLVSGFGYILTKDPMEPPTDLGLKCMTPFS